MSALEAPRVVMRGTRVYTCAHFDSHTLHWWWIGDKEVPWIALCPKCHQRAGDKPHFFIARSWVTDHDVIPAGGTA